MSPEIWDLVLALFFQLSEPHFTHPENKEFELNLWFPS